MINRKKENTNLKKLEQKLNIRNQMEKVFINRLKVVEKLRLKPKVSYWFIYK